MDEIIQEVADTSDASLVQSCLYIVKHIYYNCLPVVSEDLLCLGVGEVLVVGMMEGTGPAESDAMRYLYIMLA